VREHRPEASVSVNVLYAVFENCRRSFLSMSENKTGVAVNYFETSKPKHRHFSGVSRA
jgi:hypothetical protein